MMPNRAILKGGWVHSIAYVDFLQKLAGIQKETESLSNLTVNKMLLEGLISGLEKPQTSLVLF